MLSGQQIRSLGKRLRDNDYVEEDIEMLEEFRSTFDQLLMEVSSSIALRLAGEKIRFILAGRSKRVKSIVRKLRRQENQAMDLSRMVDIVGLRVLVASYDEQEKVIQAIVALSLQHQIADYRHASGYRAVHIFIRCNNSFRRIELQIRTIPQQLWANESESFGEEVKEGGGTPDVRRYLEQLSGKCASLDAGTLFDETELAACPLYSSRGPITFQLPQLSKHFAASLGAAAEGIAGSSIVVFDNQANELIQNLIYDEAEREQALEDYRIIVRGLDESRYETLLLYSHSRASLKATHPRFFAYS